MDLYKQFCEFSEVQNARFTDGSFRRMGYYHLTMCTSGNIRVNKCIGGKNTGLIILKDEVNNLIEVKERFLLSNSFIVGKNKCKSIKKLLELSDNEFSYTIILKK